ncbi:MAG: hypothetical protein FWD22_06890 [Treponema sp.]|nr:hypothetical protein [Treponema sp.]
MVDLKARDKLYREILSSDVSVREAEKRASSLNAADSKNTKGVKPGDTRTRKRPPEMDAMEEKFIGRLGTKVVIDGDMNKGRIQIDYYSMEDLERLYEILGGE